MKRVHQQLFYSFAFIFILLTFFSCGSGGSGGSAQTTQSGDNSNQPASNSTTGTTTPAANSGTGTPPASGNNSGSSTDPGPVATPVSTTPPAPNLNPPPDPPKGGGTSGGSTGNTEVAEWQLLGGQVNAAQRGTAVWLTLATFQNNPVVAWEEDGKIYAGFWSGSEWKVEGPLNANPNEAASLPSLAGDGQGLYLTWIEARSLYLVRREGNGWATVAVQSQQSGCAPANAGLDVRQGVPTLAWDSFCNESMYASTRVQQWAGAWVDLGGVGEHYADAPPRST